jgi:hypothetical protein
VSWRGGAVVGGTRGAADGGRGYDVVVSERDGGGPDWVREGMRQFVGEVRLFASTAFDFTLHPTRFAKEWATGARHALNPLGFLATAFAIVTPCEALFGHVMHHEGSDASLWRAALAAVLPFGYYLLVGTLQHGVLRLCGSRRPLRDSCAMALYAGGGPATVARIVIGFVAIAAWERTGSTEIHSLRTLSGALLMTSAMISFSLFYYTLSAALGGLHAAHRIRWWQILAANIVAMVGTGLLFGIFHPPGSYGLHVVISPTRGGHDWAFGIAG